MTAHIVPCHWDFYILHGAAGMDTAKNAVPHVIAASLNLDTDDVAPGCLVMIINPTRSCPDKIGIIYNSYVCKVSIQGSIRRVTYYDIFGDERLWVGMRRHDFYQVIL